MNEQIEKVESIMGTKTIQGVQYYHVKWANLPIEQATWEPIGNFIEGNQVLQDRERRNEDYSKIITLRNQLTSDIPLRIISFEITQNDELIFEIEWRPRNDLIKPCNSKCTKDWFKINHPKILVNFYEEQSLFFDSK